MTFEAAFSGDNALSFLAILLLGFAPGIFWLWFFYRKDKLEPEPKSLVARTFFWGMVVALPVAIVEVWVADPLRVLGAGILDANVLLVVLAAPIIEEYGKFFVVRRTMYDHPEFDEPMDGIVYAAAAALGFASVENVVYLSNAFFSPGAMVEGAEAVSPVSALLSVFVVRALLSVPGHALFSSIWGYALGWAKFPGARSVRGVVLKGLLLAMFLHAVFNGLLVIVPWAAAGMLILVPIMWRMVNRRIADSLERSPFK